MNMSMSRILELPKQSIQEMCYAMSMNGILELLEQRIQETRRALDGAHRRVQAAIEERDAMASDLQGYERALVAEKRRQGVSVDRTPPAEVRVELRDSLSQSDGVMTIEGGSVNKAEFVRQFVRDHAATGVTPNDIYKGFVAAGIVIRRPYIYCMVQRLQERHEITGRRGKYYPAEPGEQSKEAAIQ